ncbi:hypothetical protein CAOG_08650 [Capsaspora owczarzaki ATCC 30864]|uniref:hypothetical protein n=1 Tax=Capsaspora owczarzaki (strain ATCC 30864) TaxID=595528 RepID=UPI0003524861|nr:hypothetical protein CAOG_08650 [Capsaspora owczarzaki ATCC 30864]|eukprot:XP_011270261.1 hypothetical protein CAOG_08650 [Capsaspora owczarzaki ATCC 30864]
MPMFSFRFVVLPLIFFDFRRYFAMTFMLLWEVMHVVGQRSRVASKRRSAFRRMDCGIIFWLTFFENRPNENPRVQFANNTLIEATNNNNCSKNKTYKNKFKKYKTTQNRIRKVPFSSFFFFSFLSVLVPALTRLVFVCFCVFFCGFGLCLMLFPVVDFSLSGPTHPLFLIFRTWLLLVFALHIPGLLFIVFFG